MTSREVLLALEPRTLLSAVSWDGGGDGSSWFDAANWSANVLPGPADDVTIDIPASPSISFATSDASVRSLTCRESFELGSGSLSIATASSFAASFSQSGGTLAGTGDVTLAGGSTWSGGIMQGGGRTIVDANGSLSLRNGLSLARTLVNRGRMDWYNTNIASDGAEITNALGATFLVSAYSAMYDTGPGTTTLHNVGRMEFQNYYFTLNAGVTLDNTGTVDVNSGYTLSLTGTVTQFNNGTLSGGTWRITYGGISFDTGTLTRNQADLTFDRNGSASNMALTQNAGTLRLLNGQTSPGFGSDFVNTGTMEVGSPQGYSSSFSVPGEWRNEGVFRAIGSSVAVYGPSTHTGLFEIAAGTLSFDGGPITLTSAARIQGPGNLQFRGAPYDTDATIAVTGTVYIENSPRRFGGSFSAGTLNANSVTLTFDGPTQIGSGTMYYGNIQGAGSISIRGYLTAYGVPWRGSGALNLDPGANLYMYGSSGSILGRNLINHGRFDGSGYLSLEQAGITNASDGVMAFNGSIFGTGQLENFGLIQGTIGIGSGVTFNQSGTVSGVGLTIDGGGVSTGTWTGAGITLNSAYTFPAGTMADTRLTVNAGVCELTAPMTGSSAIEVNGGSSLELLTNQRVNTCRNATTITGPGRLQIDSRMSGAGRYENAGGVVLGVGSSSEIPGMALATSLENLGSLSLMGQVTLDGGDIYNLFGASLYLQSTSFAVPEGQQRSIDNAGLLQTVYYSSDIVIPSNLTLSSTGEVKVARRSTLRLQSNSSFAGSLTIAGEQVGSGEPYGFLRLDVAQTFAPELNLSIASGGTLQCDAAQTLNCSVTVSNQFSYAYQSSISGAGDLTVTGSLMLRGGSLLGTGHLTIQPGASFSSPAGFERGVLERSTDNFGAWTLASGLQIGGNVQPYTPIAITNHAGATMTFGGGALLLYASPVSLLNQGSIIATSGSVSLSRFENAAGATVSGPGISIMADLNNAGVITFTTGGSVVGYIANQPGATMTVAGTSLNGAVTNQGTITITGGNASGGTLINSGTFTHNVGSFSFSQMTNTGTFTQNAGNFTIGQTTNSGTMIAAAAATLSISPYLGLQGSSLAMSGSLALGGPSSVAVGASLANSGTISIAANTSLSISGTVSWTAGSISGPGRLIVEAPGALNLSGSATKTLSTTLEDYGTIIWTAGGIALNNGTINVMPSGSFTASAPLTMSRTGGTAVFQNLGQFTRSGVSAITTFASGVTFNNTGSLAINSGTLSLLGGGMQSGAVTIATNAILSLQGAHLFTPSAILTGGGTLAITAGSTTINRDQTIARLQLQGGTLQGSGQLTISGAFDWSAGTFASSGAGPSRLTISSGATATITGGSKTLTRHLTNHGLLTLGLNTLTIRGDFTQSQTGTLAVTIASLNPATGFGRVIADGGASTDGILAIALQSPFVPALGNSFDIVTAASVVCTFDHVTGPALPSGTYAVQYLPTIARLNIQTALVDGSWTGLADGTTWSLPGNWANGRLPTAMTDVHISVPGAVTIRIDPGAWEVKSIQSDEAVEFTGGTLAIIDACQSVINADVRIVSGGVTVTPGACLTVTGTLQNSGSITVHGTLSITGAFTQSSTGTLSVDIDADRTSASVVVGGAAILRGTLVANALGGFDPALPMMPDYTATLLTAAAITLQLDEAALPQTAVGSWSLGATTTSLDLSFTFADFNGDGGVDGADIESFFASWENGFPVADVNGDGGVDGADIDAFFTRWEMGG